MGRIKRRKIADSVLEEIKKMILRGELKEGDKLPDQNSFAAQLGVSRSSLREALHTLSLMGVVEQRPSLGTVIKARAPALYLDQFTPPLISDAQSTLELVVARRFIEADAVELTVENSSAEEVEEMGALVEEMRQALAEGRDSDYSELDSRFHLLIAKAAHNRFITYLFVTIRGFLEQFMRETFSVLPGLLERSLKFHQRIHQAVSQRDGDGAVEAMNEHILDIQESLESFYQIVKPKKVG